MEPLSSGGFGASTGSDGGEIAPKILIDGNFPDAAPKFVIWAAPTELFGSASDILTVIWRVLRPARAAARLGPCIAM